MARPILPCTWGSYRAYNVEQFQGTRFHCGDCNRMLDKEATPGRVIFYIVLWAFTLVAFGFLGYAMLRS